MTAYEKADARMRKKNYKGLTDKQRRYIKALEKHRQCEKELSHFYRTAKRNQYGAVDFQNISDVELDLFEHLNRENEKALKSMERLEEQIDAEHTVEIFKQQNIHSACF